MLTQVCSQVLVANPSADLTILDIAKAGCNAITFNFEGSRIKGSYKIDYPVYQYWMYENSHPVYNQNGLADFTLLRHGAIADFKLFLDEVEIDYTSNLNISELFATSIDIVNQPEEHYDYWEIQVHKGCEGQQPYSVHEATGLWGNFSLTLDNYGGSVSDYLAPGKVCSGSVGLRDPLLNEFFAEEITHYIAEDLF
jgi:hypothetical protein